MNRILLAGLAVSFGLWVAFAPADEPGGKLAKIKKKFESEEKELKKKLAAASDPEDKQQANFLIKELCVFTASDALEIAEESKKDEAGLEAAVFTIELLCRFNQTGADLDKATAIVLDHHVDNPKIGPALAGLVETGPAGLQYLQTVSEKALNKEVQALAFFYTALALDGKATRNEGRATDEAIAQARNEAVALMEKAAKLSPDTKVGTDPMTKAVARELMALKIGVGFPAPDVEGIDLDGKKIKLSSYKGKVVLFDFWATWCGPCVAMIPHERDLVERLKDKPFALLSVNVDDEKATLVEFLGKDKMPWGHWFDGAKGPLSKTFKITAFPTMYLIDAKGVVRKKWIGSPGDEVMDKAIDELVADAGKK